MGIADFFRPKYRHSDVRVRTEAVRALTRDDATTLIQIAKSDRDIGVRRIAIEKIDQPAVLAELAAAETERSLRDYAGERAAELWHSAACSDDVDHAGNALSGIIKLGDQHALVDVVVGAELAAIRKRAFGELRDPRALAALAKSEAPQDLRTAAVARIDDGDVLRALAIDTTLKEVGLAAVERLDDVDRLENVAQKAKNKAVRQKARKIVGEIQDAERAKKPGVPDDVKRKRAERAQLVREVEGVAETFDFAKASELVKKSEAAWAALGEADDGDDRFAKAVARFWKRKQIHEEQARSADELRAIEREAQASRDRAAAERAANKEGDKPAEKARPERAERSDAPDDYVREPETDAKREAREAESRARREERDKQRADDDARRAAQQADREARQKEDAERGVAIGESLRAMVTDMEQLAADAKPDMRAIDRLLSQSAKSFDQIGKVPAADRDAIADRYREVRGKLVIRVSEAREAEDWERWANVPKAEALIATAKEMFEAPATPDLGNRLRGLQALWKEVGPMPQRRSKELWDTFKTACDQVYEKVRGVRAVESEKFGEVTKVKEALIAEAETLAESTDWASTAEKLKGLQAQWKASGHLPRKQGDELWKRFRAACDKFFERRKPMLDARNEEEGENLRKKQALISRAQQVVDTAPNDGGWGKAIGTIKDLQREWKEIGFVPRRDADAVYRAFRAACDALFKKRDESRDAEANAHHAEIDAIKAEIAAVVAGGDEVVARALAVRAKASDHPALAGDVDAMVRHVLANHAEAVKGSELDPAQLRAKRDKLIARVEELMPKQAPAPSGDVAAQLKAAMGRNAFGDLRFSGRDPVEVLEDLKHEWNAIGPILDDVDHELADRFEAAIGRVLLANGRSARQPEEGAESGRRRRRDRREPVAIATNVVTAPMTTLGVGAGSVAIPRPIIPTRAETEPLPATVRPPATVVPAPLPPIESVPVASPTSVHDMVTAPAAVPAYKSAESPAHVAGETVSPAHVAGETVSPAHVARETVSPAKSEPAPISAPLAAPAPMPTPAPVLVPIAEAVSGATVAIEDAVTKPAQVPSLRPPAEPLPPPPQRAKGLSSAPPMEEIDTGWDLGDDDPTAGKVEETQSTPSSLEMAGDGTVEGDGLDSVD